MNQVCRSFFSLVINSFKYVIDRVTEKQRAGFCSFFMKIEHRFMAAGTDLLGRTTHTAQKLFKARCVY